MSSIHKCKEEGKIFETELHKQMAADLVGQIKEKFNPDKSSDILDYGAGTGLVGVEFLSFCKHVTFVEVSKGMIEYLTEKLKVSGCENYKVLLTDSTSLFSSASFDFIIAANVLHHIEDLTFLLNNFLSLLKNKGKLCISDFYTNIPFFSQPGHEMPHKGFEPEKLKEKLENIGYTKVTVNEAVPYYRKREDGSEAYGRRFCLFAEKE